MNYLIRKLELLGLCIIISQLKQLLAKVDFDGTVDILALAYIMKSNTVSASARIQRLLEVLNVYSINLYYKKGNIGL